MTTYANILVETHGRVGLIRLNRPQALNALNGALMDELTAVLDEGEADPAIKCFVITGSDRAFAAGADIKEMASKGYAEVYGEDFITRNWERASRCRKPVIAAVAGYAVGGGYELALSCDVIVASEESIVGLPEVARGLIPGGGGTQLLQRRAGPGVAAELIYSARLLGAAEALQRGLVDRVVPEGSARDVALELSLIHI